MYIKLDIQSDSILSHEWLGLLDVLCNCCKFDFWNLQYV